MHEKRPLDDAVEHGLSHVHGLERRRVNHPPRRGEHELGLVFFGLDAAPANLGGALLLDATAAALRPRPKLDDEHHDGRNDESAVDGRRQTLLAKHFEHEKSRLLGRSAEGESAVFYQSAGGRHTTRRPSGQRGGVGTRETAPYGLGLFKPKWGRASERFFRTGGRIRPRPSPLLA